MPTQDEVATVRQEVGQAFARLAAAAENLDIDAYLDAFDRNRFTALNGDGTVIHSFADFEREVRPQFAALERYRSLEFDKVKTTAVGRDSAVLVNEYRAIVRLRSGEEVEARGAGTQVWARTAAGWRLVHISASSRPE